MKVLVYDDEADFADYLREVIEDLGHVVTVATSAAEFANRFSVETDVIFLDLFMPDVDGIECIRFLAKTGTKALLILMSGQDPAILSAAREGARANSLNVLDVLTKPIAISSVDTAMEKAQAQIRISGTREVPASVRRHQITPQSIVEALEEGQFHAVYQPQIKLSGNSVTGVEALLRWNHPLFGLVLPAEFIAVAETSPDTMNHLTRFIVETACRDLGVLSRAAPDLTVSINLSAVTFNDVTLPEMIQQAAREAALGPDRIILEVTESAASSHIGRAIDILTRLRMAGFGVSIDDFGTGYSSLEQIVQIPFTELKVDKRFVKDILNSEKCRAVCEIACLLARKTSMTPVAEGVEDRATADELQRVGFVLAQGFYFARPMRLKQLLSWLETPTEDMLPPVRPGAVRHSAR
ncbi:EAL domain-containing protein [Roseibium sp.]|uniref:EAL domain-containing protein n=1 Tax=Roseibium sp. TaxID=1936156 RepID=UPI003D0CFE22